MTVMLFAWFQAKRRTLLGRFVLRVLLPSFGLLLLLSGVVFWLYSQTERQQALEELDNAAETTAIRLEREIALRRTILTTTGSEIFQLKRDYQQKRADLRSRREQCRQLFTSGEAFGREPAEVCSSFADELASLPADSRDQLQAIEDSYAEQAETLNREETDEIDRRLAAFSDFFPETLALIVVNDDGQRVSTAKADTEDDKGVNMDTLHKSARQAREQPLQGVILDKSPRQAFFAYPIRNGAVLASFHFDHQRFIRPAIEEAPIDRNTSRLLIANPREGVIYPETATSTLADDKTVLISSDSEFRFDDRDLLRTGIGAKIENTDWYAVAASPRALVLAPLRDAQLAAFVLLGGVLVVLLWVGTLYIRRLTRSIEGLVAGAGAFSAGKLDYRIDLGNANTEFLQLANTMNVMAKRIAEAEAEMDRRNKEFIDIATHELKAPMTSIIGSLSMVVEDERSARFDEDIATLLNNAYQGTTRLRDLVNDLLDIARLEGGRVAFEQEKLDIRESVNQVLETLALTAREKHISLHYDPGDTVPTVAADPSKVKVVLTNFISNAIKYNYEDGVVRITHVLGDGVLITHISDNGFGIPENQQPYMFQKFYRVDSQDHKRVSGTGLGMYTTKQYIEGMDGTVWFESTEGEGTIFSFTLPLSDKTGK